MLQQSLNFMFCVKGFVAADDGSTVSTKYSVDQIKKNELCGVCDMYREQVYAGFS